MNREQVLAVDFEKRELKDTHRTHAEKAKHAY